MREGWEYKKLGEVCADMTKGPFGSDIKKSLYVPKSSDTYKVYIQVNAIAKDPSLGDYYISKEYFDSKMHRFEVKPSDYIITCDGTLGKYLKLPENIEKGIISSSLLRLTLNDKIICGYFEYIWEYYVLRKLAKDTRNSALVHLPAASKIAKVEIPYPSLSTQESIVSELDKINELISLKKEQLKDYDNLAQSIFYDMFGDPVTNDKGWEVKKYGDCFAIGSGGTPSKSNPLYWDNGNIPWIGSNMCQNCIITETDGKYITSEGLKNSSAKMLDPGTVLVALVGATIGKVALLRISTSTNQNIAFIKVNENKLFFPEFVYYHLMNQYDEFMLIGNGDFKMANQAFIKSLTIMMPPLSLQQAFAKRIEAIEKQKQLISSEIKDLETLLASRMQYWFD